MSECRWCGDRVDSEPVPIGPYEPGVLLACEECGETVCASCAENGLCPSCAKWERP